MAEEVPLDGLEPALQVYQTLIIMQGDLDLLHETAVRLEAGTLDGLQGLGAVMVVSALSGTVGEAVAVITPPQDLAGEWEGALAVFQAAMTLLADWVHEDITVSEVVPRMSDLIPQLERIVQDVERVLAKQYQVGPAELVGMRLKALTSLDEIWETLGGMPTPVAARTTDQEAQIARGALIQFFAYLNAGDYLSATRLYGGRYEMLIGQSPTDPRDRAALFKSACEVTGLQCLRVRSAELQEPVAAAAEFEFVVTFLTAEGELFVRGPCCGASEADMPPQSEFVFTVAKDEAGAYRVLDLPVYVP